MHLPYTVSVGACKSSWHYHYATTETFDSFPVHSLMSGECDTHKLAALAALLTSTDLAATLSRGITAGSQWQMEDSIQRLNYYTPRYWKPVVASITQAFAAQIGMTGALSYDSLYCHSCDEYVEKALDPQHYEDLCGTCSWHSSECECCATCGYNPCECCPTCQKGPAWNCDCCSYCEQTADNCECRVCRNCGYKTDSCGCYGNSTYSFGSTKTAPWVDRPNVEEPMSLPRISDCENESIDPLRAAADFYLLEAMKGAVRTSEVRFSDPDSQARFSASIGDVIKTDSMLSALTLSAERSFRNLVDYMAPNFLAYALPAVGGELRYHRCAGKALKATNREQAWDHFVDVVEKKGAETLFEADTLFREFGTGAYGGERWGTAAKVVGQYLAGSMPAWLFVDRMFTLEHNGGCFLNKVNWGRHNSLHWGLSKMVYVLNAHAGKDHSGSEGKGTDWRLLLQIASPEVATMFSHMERHLTRIARRFGGILEPVPTKSHIRQYV